MTRDIKAFWRKGEPFVWMSGAALAITVLIALILIVVVIMSGMGVFWPHQVFKSQLADGSGSVMGEIVNREEIPGTGKERIQFKVGNRDLYGLDFKWIDRAAIEGLAADGEAVVVERSEYGNFYGYLQSVAFPDRPAVQGDDAWAALAEAREAIKPIIGEGKAFAKRIRKVNFEAEKGRLKLLKLDYNGVDADAPRVTSLEARQAELQQTFGELVQQQRAILGGLEAYQATFADVNGREKTMAVAEMVRAFKPADMGLPTKIGFYLGKIRELLFDEPRESNTEGGLFPALFGTVILVFIMSVFSFPFGVMAGIYLREYAKDGLVVRMVRIAVNNLAGIPSIVYGVFGLGFFIYGVGGALDHLFFPERLPAPTFGTGGILWASLTLGLLTVPVVIVSTEEAFGAIPRGVREASLALGATKYQTLTRVLLPMASPGILTGFILAMARAAGEVAPLMITGVVKLAPALPLDGQFPFVHMDRKFMHLGFHIYDIGFQSPNVEAAKPMVFVTTLLLVLVVLLMTGAAIRLRNKMKARYAMRAF